jgi:hypothetical protein
MRLQERKFCSQPVNARKGCLDKETKFLQATTSVNCLITLRRPSSKLSLCTPMHLLLTSKDRFGDGVTMSRIE